MTDQTNIFDLLAAQEARDTALTAVRAGTPDVWYRAATFATLLAATTRDTFTADHVWAELADIGFGKPPNPRALGAVIVALAESGTITPTGRWVESLRPEAHRRPCREWRVS